MKYFFLLLGLLFAWSKSDAQRDLILLKQKDFSEFKVIRVPPTTPAPWIIYYRNREPGFIEQKKNYYAKLDSLSRVADELNERYSNRDFYFMVLRGGETICYNTIQVALCYGASYNPASINILKVDKIRGTGNAKTYYKDDLWAVKF